MHFLVAGFLMTLGMLAAVGAATTIFMIVVGAAKAFGLLLLVSLVVGVL